MFTNDDLKQLTSKSVDIKDVKKQIENFKNGFPFAVLYAPATPENGIMRIGEADKLRWIAKYDNIGEHNHVVKFIPASGAASRMFKTLFEFKDAAKQNKHNDFPKTGINSPFYFFEQLNQMALYDDLKVVALNNQLDLDLMLQNRDYDNVLELLLTEKGLNYANLPKGLLKFHKYANQNRTAFEEHIVEGATYCKGRDGLVHLHFTISPEHESRFLQLFSNVKDEYERVYSISLKVDFSFQKSSTDMLAVDMENNPFRNADGTLLFRPGGHGALIENLNDIDADIVFIKNIDNVVPDILKPPTTEYKKLIGGLVWDLKEKTDQFIIKLEKYDYTAIEEALKFAIEKLYIHIDDDFKTKSLDEQRVLLIQKLNRPIRVCGMVKNEGEPGGGPFWITNSKGEVSLQIVESSQIDLKNNAQNEIFKAATHFNPVDLVCITKNYRGEKFDLTQFVDPLTGFISIKSKDGRDLKAQELPGLWNGAMADWITIFVEVPLLTFNPVKTINDLLRKQHIAV